MAVGVGALPCGQQTAREIINPPRFADGQHSCLAATKWGAAAAGRIDSIEQIGGAHTGPRRRLRAMVSFSGRCNLDPARVTQGYLRSLRSGRV